MIAITMLPAIMHALSMRNERFRPPADTRSKGRSLTVATVDLEDYWHHPGKVGNVLLGKRLASLDACKEACDSDANRCAGFFQYWSGRWSGLCQLTGRGVGLSDSTEADFYRMKSDPDAAEWHSLDGLMVPSPDVYAWKAMNGTIVDIRAKCASDSRCAGYYACDNQASATKCNDQLTAAYQKISNRDKYVGEAVLLKGVPTDLGLVSAKGLTVQVKAVQTGGGTAGGAPCSFPFLHKGLEYYEPTSANSDRPWCFTSRPDKWGYTDVLGQDSLGVRWELGEFSDCTASCGGGLRTRSVECRNTTSGEVVGSHFCGAPAQAQETCNEHSCAEGCALELEERKACGAFYDDPGSMLDSTVLREATCASYGCCWGADAKGFRCYRSANAPTGQCKFGFDGAAVAGSGAVPTAEVSQCGDQCCRGDASYGACAWTLGWAKAGEAAPCGHHDESATHVDPEGWFYYGPDMSATCEYLEAAKADTAAVCRAACRAQGKCNTVNFHEGEAICELLDCGLQRRPPAQRVAAGWGTYVWGASVSRHWKVGDWSVCAANTRAADARWEAWVGGECALTQTRNVSCESTFESGVLSDSDCLQHFIKPQSERTCWGACSANRSCEQLAWEPEARYGPGIPYLPHPATYESCGSGAVGGPYSHPYYDHQVSSENLKYFSGCHAEWNGNGNQGTGPDYVTAEQVPSTPPNPLPQHAPSAALPHSALNVAPGVYRCRREALHRG